MAEKATKKMFEPSPRNQTFFVSTSTITTWVVRGAVILFIHDIFATLKTTARKIAQRNQEVNRI